MSYDLDLYYLNTRHKLDLEAIWHAGSRSSTLVYISDLSSIKLKFRSFFNFFFFGGGGGGGGMASM